MKKTKMKKVKMGKVKSQGMDGLFFRPCPL